uniref:RNase H type-1 domain-containing protein n=1 Tax=Trichogramma kaykai TaxID=54128 RepID=A0ABD2XP94_9HYME
MGPLQHHAVRCITRVADDAIREFDKIYDCFTYFLHKFFRFGQDLYRLVQETDDSPMHSTLECGHKHVAALLPRKGAEQNFTYAEKSTPQHHISRTIGHPGLEAIIFQIIEYTKQALRVNVRDKWGKTLLHYAAHFENMELAESLLRRGVDPNLADVKGSTPLHMALVSGNKTAVELLLKNGSHANVANKDGRTPLHLVSSRKNRDTGLAKLLFKYSGLSQRTMSIDARDAFDNTPLHRALMNEHEKLAELLLRKGADASLVNKDGLTPRQIIDQKGYKDLANIFFGIKNKKRRPVKIHARDDWGRTPLLRALENEDEELSEWLLRRGSDPTATNRDGCTPLILICQNKYDRLAEILFEVNDDIPQTRLINVRDKWGNTPLHHAAFSGNEQLVESLLRRGADPNASDAWGLSALHVISDRGTADDLEWFFKIIEDIGQTASVDSRAKLGDTPLLLALDKGHKRLAESLLRRGADPNLANASGLTSLDIIWRNLDADALAIFFNHNVCLARKLVIDAPDRLGDPLLHLALGRSNVTISSYYESENRPSDRRRYKYVQQFPSLISDVPTNSFKSSSNTRGLELDLKFGQQLQTMKSPNDSLNEYIKLHAGAIAIYTDGSKWRGAPYVGAAVYVPTDDIKILVSMEHHHSSIEAECKALEVALRYCQGHRENHFVIFSDCKPALYIYARRLYKACIEPNSQKRIKCVWIPAHHGIEGNEIADKAARAATLG